MPPKAPSSSLPQHAAPDQYKSKLELVISLQGPVEAGGGGVGGSGTRGLPPELHCIARPCCAERVPCGNRNVVQFCNMGSDESADTGAEVKPDIAGDQTQQTSHITLQFTSQVSTPRYKLLV